MARILDKANPSIEEIREWAYDNDLYFIEQDEDLILYSTEYISILMELASDNDCPKDDYCLSILTYYSQILLANRMHKEIKEVEQHIAEYNLPLSEKVEKWKSGFLFITDLIHNPRVITGDETDYIAWRLTVGDFCIRDFKKLRSFDSGLVEYSASTGSYIEYFYINPKTADWKVSKYSPLNNP